jgi:hypothetical protein
MIIKGLTLNDLLVQAWINRFCVKRVEVARMIMSEEIDDANPKKAELFNIEITPDNNEQSKTFVVSI